MSPAVRGQTSPIVDPEHRPLAFSLSLYVLSFIHLPRPSGTLSAGSSCCPNHRIEGISSSSGMAISKSRPSRPPVDQSSSTSPVLPTGEPPAWMKDPASRFCHEKGSRHQLIWDNHPSPWPATEQGSLSCCTECPSSGTSACDNGLHVSAGGEILSSSDTARSYRVISRPFCPPGASTVQRP